MELICKKCGSTAYHKSGHIHGKQRYKCKQCGHQYTKTTPQGKLERDKIISLVLVLSGLSMNATAQIIGVSTQTVMRWIRKMYDKFITCAPNIDNVQEVEMDEMHHYYQKTQKLWIWKTIDHQNHNLIGWAFGHRDTKTLIKMYDSMGCKEIPHVYADRYESYKEFFPHDKLTQSKRYTSAIERIKDIGLRRFVDALL